MDKETITLVIAQNGLTTASTILIAKAAKQQKLADKATDKAEKIKLLNAVNKFKKLAAALQAADEGIKAYLQSTAE